MINLHFMKAFIPIRIALVVLAGFWLAGMPVRAQHAHIYAGAIGTGPGQPLWFENGALWDTNSWGGYGQSPACIYMDDNIPDLYPGLFQTAITFTAEPATIFNGGPIQSPSDITYFYLQAGLYLSNLSWTNYVATARFGLRGLTDYIFESSPTVDGTNWVTVEKVIGTSHSELRWVVDTNATAPVRFYRIRPATN